MARLQVLRLPDGFALVLDEAADLAMDPEADYDAIVLDRIGAKALLVFDKTVDVLDRL